MIIIIYFESGGTYGP